MILITQASRRAALTFFGGTSGIIQPNDQLINKRFQSTFRGLVRQYILDTRKADFANGVDRAIPNLTIHQLVDFCSQAFRSVTTDDVKRSYEITGFTDDRSKWSSKLRSIIENPPLLSELPAEWQIAYDPTGLSVVRRGENRANPKNLGKEWTCTVCGRQYSSKSNAKGHRDAPGGCPSIGLMKSFKPKNRRYAYFFDENF